MKQTLVYLLVLLSFAALVSAASTASVNVKKDFYNLGDKISASYNFTPSEDIDALFKLSIICETYNLPFFIYPVTLEDGKPVVLDIPKLAAAKQMVGDCDLDADIELFDQSLFERATSAPFVVSDVLNISAKLSDSEVLPGDEVVVYGSITPSYGTFSGELFVGLESLTQIDFEDNNFIHSLKVPSGSLAGEHFITVVAHDSFDNSAELKLPFSVAAVATTLVNNLNSDSFNPGEPVKLYVSVLDQGGNKMDADVSVKVFDSGNKVLFDDFLKTGDVINISLLSSAPPGNYRVKSSYAALQDEDPFRVSTVEKISAEFDNRTIKITNIGNIPYEHQIQIIFKKDDKVSSVSKNIKLGVDESTLIDLFKEVSSGNYDVEVRKDNLVIASFEDVAITDERTLLEKTGLGSVTGQIVGEGKGAAGIFWAFATVVILVLAGMLFFGRRKKRTALGMPEKKGEVEKIFEKGAKEKQETEQDKPSALSQKS